MTELPEHFAVYLFFPDEISHLEGCFLEAEAAVTLAAECSRRPAALAGFIRRIIVTDRDDFTCLEWKFGEGITFPPASIINGETQ